MTVPSLVPCMLLLSFLHLSLTCPIQSPGSEGFSIILIHRDSPISPFYNSSQTQSHRTQAVVHRSNSRAAYLSRLVNSDTSAIQPDLISADLDSYLVSLSIGTPPIKMLAIVDTSSDLVLTQCNPPCTQCPRHQQQAPLFDFDPERSSTYRELPCDSEFCSNLPNKTCGSNNECRFHYPYRNGSYSDAILASETFTIDSMTMPGIAFGCTHDHETNGTFTLGLGPGPLSLISQLGSSIDGRFSYCLVPSSENKSSVLSFGDRALITDKNVVSTPLITTQESHSLYYVHLETISLGSLDLPVWPGKKKGKGRMIIDTGTLYTYLPSESLPSLQEALADQLSLSRTPAERIEPFSLCYLNGEDYGGPIDVQLTFRFDGANVTLRGPQSFVQVKEEVACFAMLPSVEDPEVAILGSLAQQDFHIGYDLVEKKLSLAATECANL